MRKRVNRNNRCPVCSSDSWCLYSEDGSDAICMRIPSQKPITMRGGETGYWHSLNGQEFRPARPVRREPKTEIDAESMIERWLPRTKPEWICALADDLGVKASSLLELKTCWADEHKAFAFPMRDGNGKIVGIRLRNTRGEKWAVKGSSAGIFLPYCKPQNDVLIVEGPTDTAAGLSLNLFTIGRPSCSGGLLEIKSAAQNLGIRRAIIVADNDEDKWKDDVKVNPGIEGAESLARHIGIPCCIITLPTKDIREFVGAGGSMEMIESIANSSIWENNL